MDLVSQHERTNLSRSLFSETQTNGILCTEINTLWTCFPRHFIPYNITLQTQRHKTEVHKKKKPLVDLLLFKNNSEHLYEITNLRGLALPDTNKRHCLEEQIFRWLAFPGTNKRNLFKRTNNLWTCFPRHKHDETFVWKQTFCGLLPIPLLWQWWFCQRQICAWPSLHSIRCVAFSIPLPRWPACNCKKNGYPIVLWVISGGRK